MACVAGMALACCDNGTLFEERGLLSCDGVDLIKGGKSIFANRLANLVGRVTIT